MPSRLDDLEAAAGITPQACVGGIFFYGGVADMPRRRPELFPEHSVAPGPERGTDWPGFPPEVERE